MNPNLTLLAGITEWFPWYTWVFAGLLVVVLIIYKIIQNKQMG